MSQAFTVPAYQERRPSVISFRTALIGALDGEEIELSGTGYIDEAVGAAEGIFELLHIPDRVDPRSLCPYLLVGFPDASASASGCSYSYDRTYSFLLAGTTAQLSATCDLDQHENRLDTAIRLNGSMPKMDHSCPEPTVHEAAASTGTVVDGVFEIRWVNQESGRLLETATARTVYRPQSAIDAGDRLLRRSIVLRSHLDDQNHMVFSQMTEPLLA